MKQAGRKSGRFSDGAKAPEKGIGLDWDALRRQREQRLEEEIAAGVDNAETREHLRVKEMTERERREDLVRKANAKVSTPRKGGNTTGGRPRGTPKYDVDKMVELYTGEPPVAPMDIAEQIGCNYDTVITWLKRRGVWDATKFKKTRNNPNIKPPQRDGAYTQKKECDRGHDLTLPGATRQRYRANGTRNGRECLKCVASRYGTRSQ